MLVQGDNRHDSRRIATSRGASEEFRLELLTTTPRENAGFGVSRLPATLGRLAGLQLALSELPVGVLGNGLPVALLQVALLQLAFTALPDGVHGKGP